MASQVADIAFQHRQDRINLQYRTQQRVGAMWNPAMVDDLDGAWEAFGPRMVALTAAAQVHAARQAVPYINAVDRSYGQSPNSFTLAPEAFGGVMLDGRELAPAMYTAVTTTKESIGRGLSTFDAFQRGATALSVIVGTAIQDMGRQADLTLSGARTYTRYVRVCNGSACSRCAILAGIGSARDAFLRHPSCQCGTVPIVVERKSGKDLTAVPDGLYDSPEALFQAMTRQQQDHAFTKAGAEAIRHGANPVSIVNARRGAYGIQYGSHGYAKLKPGEHRIHPITIGRKPDGSPLQVYATGEGTTRHGVFGRAELRRLESGQRTHAVRLMPETIVKMAGANPEHLRELLIRFGYGY